MKMTTKSILRKYSGSIKMWNRT